MQVGSLRMVLSLEELGPAQLQATHQGPVDTATAAAAAAAQPTASLGAAASHTEAPAGDAAAGSSPTAAAAASAELQSAAGKLGVGKLLLPLLCADHIVRHSLQAAN